VLCALSRARLWVVLFPSKPCLLPTIIDCIDHVGTERCVELFCAFLVWTVLIGRILLYYLITLVGVLSWVDGRGGDIYQKSLEREVIYVYPRGAPPVILPRTIELVLFT